MTEYEAEESSDGDWADPVPLHKPRPAPLPVASLPSWLAQHVRSVAEATQTPSDLALMQGLAALSTALANKAKIQVRPSHTEPIHLWTAVVLPPASRKSAVHRHMAAPIRDYETERRTATQEDRQMAEHNREIAEEKLKAAKREWTEASTAEAEGEAMQRVRELQADLNEIGEVSAPQLLVSDVTAEKLTHLMAEHHGRIAVLSPEGEIFRLMAGRYQRSGPNFDPHKRAWTGDEPIRDDRIGREGNHVPRPALTLGICVQPSVFESLEHQRSFRGEGVLARFLYAVPEPGIGSRLTGKRVPNLDQSAAQTYQRRLHKLLELSPRETTREGEYDPHLLALSNSAREVLFDFEEQMETMLGPGGQLASIQDWGGKLVGQCVRIAGLLHAAELIGPGPHPWDRPISATCVINAVSLARALIPHARYFFDDLGQDKHLVLARYAWGRIQSAHDGQELSVREVHRRCQGKSEIESIDDLRSILDVLEDHHFIRLKQLPPQGGRPPSPRIHLNPALANGGPPWIQADTNDRSSGLASSDKPSVSSVNGIQPHHNRPESDSPTSDGKIS